MEIVVRPIDDALSLQRLDVGLRNVPLVGDDPIEALKPGWKLEGHELRNDPAKNIVGFPHRVAGDRSRERKELLRQRVNLVACRAHGSAASKSRIITASRIES
jgi:hypothetical protein